MLLFQVHGFSIADIILFIFNYQILYIILIIETGKKKNRNIRETKCLKKNGNRMRSDTNAAFLYHVLYVIFKELCYTQGTVQQNEKDIRVFFIILI